MCSVSNMGDHYTNKFQKQEYVDYFKNIQNITRAEYDALKKEAEEMKAILKRAKLYDIQTGQPDCEMDDKVALLKKVAELFGINLDEIFKSKA